MQTGHTSLVKYIPQHCNVLQYFIDGANWTQASSVDGVCSGFPGFKIQSTEIELGYLSFGGKMLGNHDKRIGL